ncbi:hypothetical protein KUCAC02_000902, partial [Chaenocephalus aceratus]
MPYLPAALTLSTAIALLPYQRSPRSLGLSPLAPHGTPRCKRDARYRLSHRAALSSSCTEPGGLQSSGSS